MTERAIINTRAGFVRGLRQMLPLSLSMIPFGLVCGALTRAHGLSFAENLIFLGGVYSGSTQLVVLASWVHPVPIVAAIMSSFVINLRMALWAPIMKPWLEKIPVGQRLLNLQMMSDVSWAFNFAEMNRGEHDAGLMAGTGAIFWIGWIIWGALGYVGADFFKFAPGHPIFFAALASFICTLVVMTRIWRDVVPIAVAALVAVGVNRMFPGTSWHIIVGTLAGVMTGLARDGLSPSADRPS